MINLQNTSVDPLSTGAPVNRESIENLPKKSIGEIDAFLRGLKLWNLELTRSYQDDFDLKMLEIGIDSDEERLSPGDINERFGLEVEEPMYLAQAILARDFRDEKDTIAAEFGKWGSS